MALHTVKNSAEQKSKPAFLHFEKPSQDEIKPGYINLDLNAVMKNMGAPQFAYETFKTAYDSDPSLQEYVDNFSAEGIEINSDDAEEEPAQDNDDTNSVGDMAKAATDLSDSPLG
jgi:hypothetical protein